MATAKRRVDVFTAGCPLCEDTVKLMQSFACPPCVVQVYDLPEGYATNACRDKPRQYDINTVPAIVVNGVLLDCCRRQPITADALRAAGIGQS